VIMPTVKQLVVIAIAIAAAIVGAGTVGISAIEHSGTQEHSATQVPAKPLHAFKGCSLATHLVRLHAAAALGRSHLYMA
jgi:hypothetical protein